MSSRVRSRLTYANVMSTVAVFVALGGSSYAAFQIDSADIENNSVRGVDIRNRTLTERDVRRNSLGGRSIRESRLGRVPRARNAERLGGLPAEAFLLSCPTGMYFVADVCVETTHRAAMSFGVAIATCANATEHGRRLPTYGELRAALGSVRLAPGGELTSEVYPSTTSGELNVLYVTDQGGSTALTPNTGAGGKAFRCVADPLN